MTASEWTQRASVAPVQALCVSWRRKEETGFRVVFQNGERTKFTHGIGIVSFTEVPQSLST